jgi:predicted nuclease of predicted toxin-antitoxin system
MKLLFDQNLSPRLVNHLDDLYPDASHMSEIGLGRALDIEIWKYARKNHSMIVSKDSDFSELSAT